MITKNEIVETKRFIRTFGSSCFNSIGYDQNKSILYATNIVESDIGLVPTLKKIVEKIELKDQNLLVFTKIREHTVVPENDPKWEYVRELDYSVKEEKKYDCGRVILNLSIPWSTKIKFENPDFIHGHLFSDGMVYCWGTYKQFDLVFRNLGPTAMIIAMIAFAQTSRYKTHLKGEAVYNARGNDAKNG
jgi:hypothetical protein